MSCRLAALKMETAFSSKTSVSTFESTRRHNTEQHRHSQRGKNLKPETFVHKNDILMPPRVMLFCKQFYFRSECLSAVVNSLQCH
jgi:hypothetical protein